MEGNRMVQKTRVLYVGGGLAAILLAGLLLGGSFRQPAQAQPAPATPAPAVGRYQIASFVLQQRETPGAYILDTQTGEVFQVVGKNPSELIGSVAKAQPKK